MGAARPDGGGAREGRAYHLDRRVRAKKRSRWPCADRFEHQDGEGSRGKEGSLQCRKLLGLPDRCLSRSWRHFTRQNRSGERRLFVAAVDLYLETGRLYLDDLSVCKTSCRPATAVERAPVFRPWVELPELWPGRHRNDVGIPRRRAQAFRSCLGQVVGIYLQRSCR